MIYIIVALFVLYPALHYEFSSKKTQEGKVFYWVECIVLILFMGLRYRVGGDSLRYEGYFQTENTFSQIIKYGFENNYAQPLWQLLQGLCIEVFGNFYALQIVQATIVNFSIFYVAKRYCNHKFTFVVLYYLLQYLYFNTEIMRESLAVAFFLLSFPFLEKGKYLWFYLFAIIAFFFHVSAVILFFIPLIYKLLSGNNQWKTVIYFTVILTGIYLMVDDIVGVFLENLFVDNNSIQMKVRGIGDGDGLNIYGVIMALLLMIPYFLSYRYIKYSSIDTPINRFVVNMSILFTVLGMFFLTLTRLQNYFAIPFLFVFADLVHDKVVAKKFQYDILIATIILLFARFSYYASPIAGGSGATHFRMYYPYHSIFNPVVDKERERAIDMQFY